MTTPHGTLYDPTLPLISTLLVRKLPDALSPTHKASLLQEFGAIRARVMSAGPLKGCVFADWPDPVRTKQALTNLHQLDVLGSRLIVEYAKLAPDGPKLPGLPPAVLHPQPTAWQPQSSTPDTHVQGQSHDDYFRVPDRVLNFFKELFLVAPHLGPEGLSHPPLGYKYPPPTHVILENIASALLNHPAFYTQVLHLMNKMDLPPPFTDDDTVRDPLPYSIGSSNVLKKSCEKKPLPPPDDMEGTAMSESESELDSDDGDTSSQICTKTTNKQEQQHLRNQQNIIDPKQSSSQLGTPKEKVAASRKRPPPHSRHIESKSARLDPKSTVASILIDPTALSQIPVPPPTRKTFATPDLSTGTKEPATTLIPTSRVHSDMPTATSNKSSEYDIKVSSIDRIDKINNKPGTKNKPVTPTAPSKVVSSSKITDLPLSAPIIPLKSSAISISIPSSKYNNNKGLSSNKNPETPVNKFPVGSNPGTGKVAGTETSPITSVAVSTKDSVKYANEVPKGFGVFSPAEPSSEAKESTPYEPVAVGDLVPLEEIAAGQVRPSEWGDHKVLAKCDPTTVGEPFSRLYVKNIAKGVTERDLKRVFGNFAELPQSSGYGNSAGALKRPVNGKPKIDVSNSLPSRDESDISSLCPLFDIRLMTTGRLKGQAFVSLGSVAAATRALQATNAFMLKGKPIVVSYSRAKPPTL